MIELQKDDKFSDAHGNWLVLQVHPPYGRRKFRLVTLLNIDTNMAEQVEEPLLFEKTNNLKMIEEN